jgi:hypothetical protein
MNPIQEVSMAIAVRHVVVATIGAMLLVGCGREVHPSIPAGATMGSEGTGRLSYAVPHDGEVFVYDVNRNELVFASQINRDQEIIVDPQADRITIDGRTMLERRLNRGNRHRVYFQRANTSRIIEVERPREVEVEVERR